MVDCGSVVVLDCGSVVGADLWQLSVAAIYSCFSFYYGFGNGSLCGGSWILEMARGVVDLW